LPEGVFVAVPARGEQAYLVRGDSLLAWSPGRPKGAEVNLLTPPSTTATIRAGYAPGLDPSAVVLA
jgi:hypothetical protein